ncbi:unnamed protein product [Closterium sp. Naga37s-1]|nr:unnamed protein product [Closterium sp. Naga37s-1]
MSVLGPAGFADLLRDITRVVSKHLKSIDDGSDSKRDHSDDVNMALIDQVHKLSLQVQQLSTSSRPITVVNTPPAQQHQGSIVGYVVPVAVIGAAGYGVMWWKGWRVSDLMYVTRRKMDQAVKLFGEKVTELQTALDTAKKQLAGRLEGVSKSVAEGLKMQAVIKKDVIEVKGVVTSVSRDLDNMHGLVEGMDTKLASLEQKQDIATRGVLLLCSFVSRGLQGNPGNQELLKGLADMSQMAVPQLAAGKGAAAGGAVGLSGLKELEFISSALESSVHHSGNLPLDPAYTSQPTRQASYQASYQASAAGLERQTSASATAPAAAGIASRHSFGAGGAAAAAAAAAAIATVSGRSRGESVPVIVVGAGAGVHGMGSERGMHGAAAAAAHGLHATGAAAEAAVVQSVREAGDAVLRRGVVIEEVGDGRERYGRPLSASEVSPPRAREGGPGGYPPRKLRHARFGD